MLRVVPDDPAFVIDLLGDKLYPMCGHRGLGHVSPPVSAKVSNSAR